MAEHAGGACEKILRETFGFEQFRDRQGAIVAHVASGGDAVVIMPTGAGKSLCYQIPAMARAGTGIVVSPLIALMNDQVQALREHGVRAGALNSACTRREAGRLIAAARAGTLDLLYLSPERALGEGTLALLDSLTVALIAIDEAHCVSEWGHDFRPEYQALGKLRKRHPSVPCVALTATADAPTRREIDAALGLEDARHFICGFDRANIDYAIEAKHQPKQQLEAFVEERRGRSGIVYCLSRNKTEHTARHLAACGHKALAYHAGMDAGTRNRHQAIFQREDDVVMVATIAFGMGVDKPNVRFVAHTDLPKSVEAYYQETGRAGRDAAPAEAWMSYGLGDVATVRHLVETSESPERRKAVERRKLAQLLALCEVTSCRRQALLAYFGEAHGGACGRCDNCRSPAEAVDATTLAQKALSCIYRTGQRFGAGHVVDVLRGSDTEKVRRWGHQRLSTFGIGTDTSARTWHRVLRQLGARAIVDIDVEGHGALRLAEGARAVLRGEAQVTIREEAPRAARSRRRTRTREARSVPSATSETLLRALKRQRSALAKAKGVAPYIIFHDATLVAMAEQEPEDAQALESIPGMGRTKMERYGAVFLEVIRTHAEGESE